MATAKKKPPAPKKKPPAPKKKPPAPKKKPPAPKKKPAPPKRRPVAAAGAPTIVVDLPPIPFDIAPHFARVRKAIGELVATLKRQGVPVKLGAPASVEAILTAERARGVALPNEYRALLTLHDGMILFDRKFLGTRDYREDTLLTQQAREYLQSTADLGFDGIEACIPLANWGQPKDWLLYDPRGKVRGGAPGHVVMLDADPRPARDLCDALHQLEKLASRPLGGK